MLGIILAFASAIFFGMAVSIQKHSLGTMKRFSVKGMISNRKWILSMIVGAVGLVLYAAALSMESLSTVQPVASVYLLIPILAGAFVFKEKLGARKWLLVGIFLIGIALVSLY